MSLTKKLGFGAPEYSEFQLILAAAGLMLPVSLIMIVWEPSRWYRGLVVWVVTSGLAYFYGLWVRDDEETSTEERTVQR